MNQQTLRTPENNQEMFNAISKRYDLLNRLMSLGQDQVWRNKAIDLLQVQEQGQYADVGCGTADLAIGIAERFGDPHGKVYGIDHSDKMLAVGQGKIAAHKLESIITLKVGDAVHLPFPDASLDGVISGFVIRNITDRPAALQEWGRVLKPGGRCVILELSKPDNIIILTGYLLFTNLLVRLASLFLSKYRAYNYLLESIHAFPPAPKFMAMMHSAGFQQVTMKALMWGAVRINCGTKRI